jgi:hypothetical protein
MAAPIAKPGLPVGWLVIHQNTPRKWNELKIGIIKETAERGYGPRGREPRASPDAQQPAKVDAGCDLSCPALAELICSPHQLGRHLVRQ